MANIIGEASEFWRLRLTRVDESDEPDLEWREDILYRRPTTATPGEDVIFRIDAVSLDEKEQVPVATFGDSQTAHDYLSQAEEDLGQMTKAEFERAYLTADTAAAEYEEPNA